MKSYSQVNLAEGSFRLVRTDLISSAPTKPSPSSRIRSFQLLRAYSSKSTQAGMFGMGWCSNLETKLIVSSSQLLEIQSCPLRAKLKFKRKASPPTLNRFISMINNDALPAPTTEVFESDGSQNGIISPTDDGWMWTKPDGSWHKFSKEGLILEDSFTNGKSYRYRYNFQKKLSEFFVNENASFKISHTPSQVEFGDTQFQFQGRLLASVQKNKILKESFEYDEMDNLTKWTSLKEEKRLQYDELDRVTNVFSYIGTRFCRDQYFYSSALALQLKVEQNHQCQDEASVKKQYEFDFGYTPKQEKILKRVAIRQGSEHKQIFFDPVLGRINRLITTEGQDLRLNYLGSSSLPQSIEIKNEGLIQLSWQGGKAQIQNIQSETSTARLRLQISDALEMLLKASNSTPKEVQ